MSLFRRSIVFKIKTHGILDNREDIFYRYCSGEATPGERVRVESLVAADAAAAAELALVAEAVGIERELAALRDCDTERALRRTWRTIGRRRVLSVMRRTMSRAASIAALPLLASTVALGYAAVNDRDAEPTFAEITAAPGSVSRLELPDHSRVWLNAGATLRYPTSFAGDAREVLLTGEGYFEVRSDAEHPFIVSTPCGVKVAAYGTRFNVDTADGGARAVLAEGSVSLLFDDRQPIAIRAGEQAVFDAGTGGISVEATNLYEKLAWKDGRIVFRGATLTEVFRRLEQRYNVDIEMHDPAGLSDRYSARVTFTDETIQQIFTYLSAAAPLRWKLVTVPQNDDYSLPRQRIDVWLDGDAAGLGKR